MTHRVIIEKEASRMSLYLEDIHDLPDLLYGNHDTWSHLHSTGNDLRFPKRYGTYGVWSKNNQQEYPCTWRTLLMILMVPNGK